MAKIERYTANVALQPGGTPSVNLDDAFGRALTNFGNTLSVVGEAKRQRDEERENFRAENDYRKLKLETNDELANAEMADDGAGFHDGFMKDVFAPKRDAFIASLPDRLKEKFGVLLGDGDPDGQNEGFDRAEFSVKAATRERDKSYDWARTEASVTQEQLRAAVATNPEAFDEYLKAGNDLWDSTPLPRAEKEAKKREWENLAQYAFLDQQLQKDPAGVIRALGGDISSLAPATKTELLAQAVEAQESGGEANPDSAISSAGARGRMQIMPNTAREIARELKDPAFRPNMSDEEVGQYLSNTAVNRRYGTHYLNKMLRRYNGDVQAALIAYNGGPARADAWLKANRSDSVIPKESANYYKQVLKRLPGFQGPTANGLSPNDVQFETKGNAYEGNPFGIKGDAAAGNKSVSFSGKGGFKSELGNRVATAFGSLGIKNVNVTSGYRDPVHNAKAGGAKKSQHIHRNAMDIDVTGYNHAKRVEIIRALSAAGIGGIGVGNNIIHADIGSRRAWGYATSAGGGEVPGWAKGAISEHLSNTAKTPSAGGRFASVPYEQRQKYISQADTAIAQQTNARSAENVMARIQLQTEMQNELARVTRTGQMTDAVKDEQVAELLGVDDLVKWAENKRQAQQMFTARDGIISMSAEEMAARVEDYKADPSSPNFAADQKIEKAVVDEVDRVNKLRSTDPAKAAMEDPSIREAWDKVQSTPAGSAVDPVDVQAFIRANLEKQNSFNIAPGTRQPLPRSSALALGQALTRQTEAARNKPVEGYDARNSEALAILQFYEEAKKVYGEYTEEALTQALIEYKGMSKEQAELVTGYMQAIDGGRDPKQVIRARPKDDQAEVEELGFFDRARKWWAGDDETGDNEDDSDGDQPDGPAADRQLSSEQRLRLREDLRDATPEIEAELVGVYGQAAVDAAKRSIGNE